MFARVTSFENRPDRIDEAVRIFREDVLPWLSDATGFRGSVVLLDREQARTIVMTFWATEDAARDDEAAGARVRDEVTAAVEARIRSAGIYELALVESLALGDGG